MNGKDDHRGPHPQDARDLGPEAVPTLRAAVADLSWLLGRGYSDVAATKLVGDRFGLSKRQRMAVGRSSCADEAAANRRSKRVDAREAAVDAFNVLITLERALSGGPVLVGRDGAWRDIASVHGTWRAVAETPAAIEALANVLDQATFFVDAPVSNSGRLAAMLRENPRWTVEVVRSPDHELLAYEIVATSDAWILDRCKAWTNLVAAATKPAWLVDLS